jgi:hypothetical protein
MDGISDACVMWDITILSSGALEEKQMTEGRSVHQ